jgi:glycerol kinase
MDSIACRIGQLHLDLLKAFPETLFLWLPADGDATYSNSIEWDDTRTSELINHIREMWPGEPDVIQLTLKDGTIYFK